MLGIEDDHQAEHDERRTDASRRSCASRTERGL